METKILLDWKEILPSYVEVVFSYITVPMIQYDEYHSVWASFLLPETSRIIEVDWGALDRDEEPEFIINVRDINDLLASCTVKDIHDLIYVVKKWAEKFGQNNELFPLFKK